MRGANHSTDIISLPVNFMKNVYKVKVEEQNNAHSFCSIFSQRTKRDRHMNPLK